MTEAEWQTCADPTLMLEFLRGKVSNRKLRLFAVACCRRISHLFSDKHISRRTIEFAERFADGEGTKNDLHGHAWGKPGQAHPVVQYKAWDAAANSADYGAGMVKRAVLASDEEIYKAWENAFDTAWLQQGYPLHEAREIADASMPADWVARGKLARSEEQECQSFVFRDIFAYPFRPIAIDAFWLVWNDGALVKMAQAIYDHRTFDRLPILADALEDAGCTNAHILTHCRRDGPHVRGCWVIDLLLGKE